jgi:hypothetical protein
MFALQRGSDLVREGEQCPHLFVIFDGTATVSRHVKPPDDKDATGTGKEGAHSHEREKMAASLQRQRVLLRGKSIMRMHYSEKPLDIAALA